MNPIFKPLLFSILTTFLLVSCTEEETSETYTIYHNTTKYHLTMRGFDSHTPSLRKYYEHTIFRDSSITFTETISSLQKSVSPAGLPEDSDSIHIFIYGRAIYYTYDNIRNVSDSLYDNNPLINYNYEYDEEQKTNHYYFTEKDLEIAMPYRWLPY